MLRILILVLSWRFSSAFGMYYPVKMTYNQRLSSLRPSTRLEMASIQFSKLGGTVVVTGVGEYEEDEFLLGLLSRQVPNF